MQFTGQIFFNFETYDVWRIYTMLLRAARGGGVAVSVEWIPFLLGQPPEEAAPSRAVALGACAAVRNQHPESYDKFVRALLTMTFEEKDNPGSKRILAVAAKVAGLSGDDVIASAEAPGLELLRVATESGRELGVTNVPTIVRQGPPLYVRTTAAVGYGDASKRLALINEMLDDDGVWELSKP